MLSVRFFKTIITCLVLGLGILAVRPIYATSLADETINQGIIDDVRLVSSEPLSVTSEELAEAFEIPWHKSIDMSLFAQNLQELETKLKASGRFKNTLRVKLEKGKRPQHYLLVIELEATDAYYSGIQAAIFNSEENWEDTSSSMIAGQLGYYRGTRSLNLLGLGGEIGSEVVSLSNNASTNFQKTYHSRYHDTDYCKISGFILKNGFLISNLYLMTGITLSSARTKNGVSYHTLISKPGENDKVIDSEFKSSEMDWSAIATSIVGWRWNQWNLVGTATIDRSRAFHYETSYSSMDYVHLYNEGPSVGEDIERTLAGSISYSGRPGIYLVEQGFRSQYEWSRSYFDHKVRPVENKFSVDGTFMVGARDALSPTAIVTDTGGGANERVQKVGLGVKWSAIVTSNQVLEIQFLRSGDSHYFLRRSSTRDSDNFFYMDSQVSLGLRYASANFIYDLTAIIGNSMVSSGLSDNESALKRQGIPQ
jgi:hypothetical protein